MTASRRGFVVGGGQIGIGDEGGDGGPIVEDLAGERPNLLGLIVAVKLAGPLQPGKHRIDDARAGALGDRVDQAAYLAQQPRPKMGALWVDGQSDALADQMGQTPLPFLELAIGPVAVAQPRKASPIRSRISSPWRDPMWKMAVLEDSTSQRRRPCCFHGVSSAWITPA
jgi:hypothetical protein